MRWCCRWHMSGSPSWRSEGGSEVRPETAEQRKSGAGVAGPSDDWQRWWQPWL